jgi:hypothetical protein
MKKLLLILLCVSFILLYSSCSKQPLVPGCIDPSAINFDSLANTDDGSCIIFGCTDSTSSNYNVLATVSDTSCEDYIGQFKYGGVIFWKDPYDNTKGLVCDTGDLKDSPWGCLGDRLYDIIHVPSLPGTSFYCCFNLYDSIGSGKWNTEQIVYACNDQGTAAKRCYNLNRSGYDDWFLPSSMELSLICDMKFIIDSVAVLHGGSQFVKPKLYWSSTNYAMSGNLISWIWIQYFNNVWHHIEPHHEVVSNEVHGVRAIRAF